MTAKVLENFSRLSNHAVGPENSSTNHSHNTGGYLRVGNVEEVCSTSVIIPFQKARLGTDLRNWSQE